LGYKQGYSLPKPTLPNPVNIIMVQASKVIKPIITQKLGQKSGLK